MGSTYGRAWAAAMMLTGCQLTSDLPRAVKRREPPPPPTEILAPPDDEVRPYLLFEPPTEAPVPLVMILHGYTGSAEGLAEQFHAHALAAEHGYAIAVPDGTRDAAGQRFWNATDACCDFEGSGVDDVRALREVIAHVASRRAIDRQRVAVVGYSNGAFMAHRLACDASGDLAAIVAIAGTGWNDPNRCHPTSPVAVLQIHGDADRAVSIDGGRVLQRGDVEAHPAPSLTARRWAARNGCMGQSASEGHFAQQPSEETTWDRCDAPVAFWRVTDGPHVLGTDPASVARITGWIRDAFARLASAPPPL